jgi:phosphatidylserine decarboxylase
MRRIVSEVKNSFTTVFSVFQNLEKPTWLRKKKIKYFFGGGFCPFGEFCQKTGFLDFFQPK